MKNPDRQQQADAAAIVGQGRFAILDHYALRDEITTRFRDAVCDGVEQIGGMPCRRALERDGLKSLHRHFPVEKVDLLEAFILERMRDELYYWSCMVGMQNLGLKAPFFVDYLIVIRIHYPYLVARKGKESVKPPFPFGERFRLAWAAIRNPRLLVHHVAKLRRLRKRRLQGSLTFDPTAYHGNQPGRARAHGPHVDTWYGHSYDGINLWLSIDGVNEDNTVILYPEMFGRKIQYDPTIMYLAAGIPLPRPTKILLQPGQLLLFNPEVLHGTQVNISDETRIALTTRVNPGVPRFNDEAPFNFEHWLSSEDLVRRRFNRIRLFPANELKGEPSVRQRVADSVRPVTRLRLPPVPGEQDELVLCASEVLRPGDKIAIDGLNLQLMLIRTPDGVKAYDRRCPHRGIDLIDGYHDADVLFCPGHGVAFSLADGTSKCSAFTLRAADVSERDGQIFLRRRKAAVADPAMSATIVR